MKYTTRYICGYCGWSGTRADLTQSQTCGVCGRKPSSEVRVTRFARVTANNVRQQRPCGCYIEHLPGREPAFYACTLHGSAPDLARALRDLLGSLQGTDPSEEHEREGCGGPDSCTLCSARMALQHATAKPRPERNNPVD